MNFWHWDFLWYQNFWAFYAHKMVFWDPPGGAQKVQKWVNGASFVNIGQLNHCEAFGTKSGAVQDFHGGKKCPVGVKQTPLDQR